MTTQESVLKAFKPLTPAEVDQVEAEGLARRWVDGDGRVVSWANSTVTLQKKLEDGSWCGVAALGTSMTGILPYDWALYFSGGLVKAP
ncbi:hypothetical protein BHE90_005947 [Fusarium euwallaceae]|uniref:Uncharacterized protein n=5 Tax=Fusarium solani species complex TaxID=232080 RepID=A0A3M2RW86_9HYPO|nr:hypothetical protein CDV36_010799 [Fusarium kuroshium]RSL86720.1 hypothetical protein CEP51_002645 [Fusarium floridanum]RSM05614.1 hypothetical protein CEP52_006186 [Fusarium oligoseptatum]RSM19926.1 hypothetical protein CDV31_001286 [Fusarium ambrosium]RTE79545.1 hypothetical protein BHE90_005947 [Fusarium euwallaceae]